MSNPLKSFGARFTAGHTVFAAAFAPLCVLPFLGTRYQWWAVGVVALVLVFDVVTFRARRLGGWVPAVFAWLGRRRKPLDTPTETVTGATVMPGEPVAIRWQGDVLVSLVELVPRPFTPTVIVDRCAHTDDVVDTQMVERLLAVHCPDLQADVVSAGYRVGVTEAVDVGDDYQTLVGSDPAPAHRRTWIVLRADPGATRSSAQRRAAGVEGMVRYLVASTTRMADGLAGLGVDAACSRTFDDFDAATQVSFQREKWSKIKGQNGFTTAYTARGGPDVWWSADAERTITRVRVAPGRAPRSTVLLTTASKPKRPRGFSVLSGAQRASLEGQTLVADRHHELPIGSAGVLVGETARRHRIYVPFDAVDSSINLEDAHVFLQFTLRSAAAGGVVTLAPEFGEYARLIGAEVGPQPKVTWARATTYIGPHPGAEHVVWRHGVIDTPCRRWLPIREIPVPAQSRYTTALPKAGSVEPKAGSVEPKAGPVDGRGSAGRRPIRAE